MSKTPVEVLRDARKLIVSEERWITGEYEIDGCYCATGAVAAVAGIDIHDAEGSSLHERERHPALALLKQAMGGKAVHVFNDSHTHTEVLAAFDRAIALAEAAK